MAPAGDALPAAAAADDVPGTATGTPNSDCSLATSAVAYEAVHTPPTAAHTREATTVGLPSCASQGAICAP